jgi:hypothetical protein
MTKLNLIIFANELLQCYSIVIIKKLFSIIKILTCLFFTSDSPRLRTGAILILKCFSTITYSHARYMGYLTLKEFFKSD